MSLWVIVPVKPLKRAKSRLASVLEPEQRARFAEAMLRQVLSVIAQVRNVTGVLVISRDSGALAIAREMGAKTILESSNSDLNPALERATEVVRVWGAEAVLILPADLPFVTPRDIQQMAEMAAVGTRVVIAPDRHQDGTNALLVRPAGIMPYAYGVNSYERHVIAARLAGADVREYQSDTVQLDIDLPEDLEEYNQRVISDHIELLHPFPSDLTA